MTTDENRLQRIAALLNISWAAVSNLNESLAITRGGYRPRLTSNQTEFTRQCAT